MEHEPVRTLTPAQRSALKHVEGLALDGEAAARSKIAKILDGARVDSARYDAAIQSVRSQARVVVHFHPDRICRNGATVAQGLLR